MVYRAFDHHTQQHVALKVVAAEAGVAPEDETRLRREGELVCLRPGAHADLLLVDGDPLMAPGAAYYLLCFSDRVQPLAVGPRRVSEAELSAAFDGGWAIEAIEGAEIAGAYRMEKP